MTVSDLIANARVCAQDALTLLDAADKLIDPAQKADVLASATGLLHVGSEEANRAKRQLTK
jgi:hypothetical protein